MTLSQLQSEVAQWGSHNFPNAKPHHPLLGINEEAGELSHAHLKMEQGIRGTKEEHQEAKGDAIADLMIFAAHYCHLNQLDLEGETLKAWNQVKARDWIKYPKNGKDA